MAGRDCITAPKGAGSFPARHPADGIKVLLAELSIRKDIPRGIRVRASILQNLPFVPSARSTLAHETSIYVDASRRVIGTSLWRACRDASTWSGIGTFRVLFAYSLLKLAVAVVERRSS